ncbi:cytochrome c3 family protein [Consotaella salsifontis]|uniref:Quinol:cytochrome c oxidoreductase pentaheme cytochrome subunit n=1 Tax=Consotaella salsifontis TaxID=1365950 RepID=A0A1T4PMU9_9HYPH|nr:cytochrome c3 family protein [Consotaella salsifontis]SJZ92873.1 quinol:cytochrome c oxidoreductase pentaheme cytochrome subunit [Consotaella salsifontis]
MPQIFRPGANAYARIVLVCLVTVPVISILVVYVVMGSSFVTGQNVFVDQSPPFSHQHHVGALGIGCKMCHVSVEKSAFAGLPTTHVCMTCHSQIWTNAPMLAPVRASMAEDKPLKWRRVNNLPDYVFFDHSAHVKNGVGCSSCHGAVDTMPLMEQAKPLTMSWCLSCHEAPEKMLRPEDQIYNLHWSPPKDQEEKGKALIAHYAIDPKHLIDCSVCHR